LAGALESLIKPIEKHVPQAKKSGMQIVSTSISGVGFDQVGKVLDNFIGSPFQRFGVTLPVVGRLSVLDMVNYLVHNRGRLVPGKDFRGPIAVLAAKGVQTGFNLGNISGLFGGQTLQQEGGTIYAE